MFPKGLVSCYRALSCYLLFVYGNLITPCVDTGVSFSHQDLYARCSPGGEFFLTRIYTPGAVLGVSFLTRIYMPGVVPGVSFPSPGFIRRV